MIFQPSKRSISLLPFTLAAAIALTACTVESQGTELKTEFHPPLTYAEWKKESFTTQDGQPACAVTSGHNGISVFSHHVGGGRIGVLVKSNRPLPPGNALKVNVNGNHYETSQEFFPAGTSLEITQDLTKADKAYLEWTGPHSGGNNRIRSSNILRMEGFAELFEQCRLAALNKS